MWHSVSLYCQHFAWTIRKGGKNMSLECRKTQVQILAQFISCGNLNEFLNLLVAHSFFLDKKEIIQGLNEALATFLGT